MKTFAKLGWYGPGHMGNVQCTGLGWLGTGLGWLGLGWLWPETIKFAASQPRAPANQKALKLPLKGFLKASQRPFQGLLKAVQRPLKGLQKALKNNSNGL